MIAINGVFIYSFLEEDFFKYLSFILEIREISSIINDIATMDPIFFHYFISLSFPQSLKYNRYPNGTYFS
jgi:hypothetical protein